MLAALWFTPSVSVNLPRWGLKLGYSFEHKSLAISVNLPRWGLKQNLHFQILVLNELCKFTPLWFETSKTQIKKTLPKRRVNLPRWGLKLG